MCLQVCVHLHGLRVFCSTDLTMPTELPMCLLFSKQHRMHPEGALTIPRRCMHIGPACLHIHVLGWHGALCRTIWPNSGSASNTSPVVCAHLGRQSPYTGMPKTPPSKSMPTAKGRHGKARRWCLQGLLKPDSHLMLSTKYRTLGQLGPWPMRVSMNLPMPLSMQSCASGLCAVRACTSHTWQVLLGCSGWDPCISKAFSALLSPFRLGLTAPEWARMGRTGNVAASNPWQHRHVYLFACCVLWHPVAAHGYGTSFGHCELKGRDCGEWSCLCGWLVGCLCSLGMSRSGGHLVHGLKSMAGVGMGLGK